VGAAVNRFDYLGGLRRTSAASGSSSIAIDNRIRVPLAAFLAAITIAGAINLVQLTRLHAAQRSYARTSLHLMLDEPALREAGVLRARIVRETQLVEFVSGLRQTSLGRANELAWIGNHLPAHTWLRTLRYENGNYMLDGTSDRAAAVGTAMVALRDATHATATQLVSLHDDGGSTEPHVRYTLRVEQQR
jgi:hypothetical protein